MFSRDSRESMRMSSENLRADLDSRSHVWTISGAHTHKMNATHLNSTGVFLIISKP